jgi:hypothetical protein
MFIKKYKVMNNIIKQKDKLPIFISFAKIDTIRKSQKRLKVQHFNELAKVTIIDYSRTNESRIYHIE